ncbi:MAG: hypothetical protein JXA99_00510 [Candidatus Lokiarchaeota archaeon]|nr:hypothetical protein [Candidatus Lokiarchaeota archaeon]
MQIKKKKGNYFVKLIVVILFFNTIFLFNFTQHTLATTPNLNVQTNLDKKDVVSWNVIELHPESGSFSGYYSEIYSKANGEVNWTLLDTYQGLGLKNHILEDDREIYGEFKIIEKASAYYNDGIQYNGEFILIDDIEKNIEKMFIGFTSEIVFFSWNVIEMHPQVGSFSGYYSEIYSRILGEEDWTLLQTDQELGEKEYSQSLDISDTIIEFKIVEKAEVYTMNGNTYYGPHILYEKILKILTDSDTTLLLVHGFWGSSSTFNDLLSDTKYDNNGNGINDFKDHYGINNILKVDYYSSHDPDPEFSGFTINTPIEDVSRALKNYIINNKINGKIKDHLDIIAHSMGGLVVRYMIEHEHYYEEIKNAGVTIDNIATVGTPNHGTLLSQIALIGGVLSPILPIVLSVYGVGTLGIQIFQMAYIHAFILDLNSGDETPHSRDDSGEYSDIHWSTYRGHVRDVWWEPLLCPIIWLVYPLYNPAIYKSDSVVDTGSVSLGDGATNHYYNGFDHDEIKSKTSALNDIFNELQK